MRKAMDSSEPRCPICGYSEADAAYHLDHHLCRGEIPTKAGAKPMTDSKTKEWPADECKSKECGGAVESLGYCHECLHVFDSKDPMTNPVEFPMTDKQERYFTHKFADRAGLCIVDRERSIEGESGYFDICMCRTDEEAEPILKALNQQSDNAELVGLPSIWVAFNDGKIIGKYETEQQARNRIPAWYGINNKPVEFVEYKPANARQQPDKELVERITAHLNRYPFVKKQISGGLLAEALSALKEQA